MSRLPIFAVAFALQAVLTSSGMAQTGRTPPRASETRGPLASGTLAIVNVTVVPMSRDTVLRSMTVLARNGRIVTVGPTGRTRVPAGATVIDGEGKYLIPGLADMHTHLFSDAAAVNDSAAPAEVGVMLANGVTTARLMIGRPQHLELRRDVASGKVLGPMLWLAGPQITGREDENAFVATTSEEARAAVRQIAEGGYDFVKLTNYISRPVYDAVVDEAKLRNIRVVGHVDPQVGVARALEAGEQIEHLDGYFEAALADTSPVKKSVTQMDVFDLPNWKSLDYIDDRKIARLAGATARARVFVGPTQNVFNSAFARGESDSAIRNRPDWRFWPARLREGYLGARARYWMPSAAELKSEARRARYVEVRNKLVKAIHDSGGTIMAGSDTPEWFNTYGWGLHRELQALVAAGLTPYQALVAATRTPAAFVNATGDWGTIASGRRADLVLLGGNPLADIRNTMRIEAVAFGGRWLNRAMLDSMIERGAIAVAGGKPVTSGEISEQDILTRASAISADSMEGRNTGRPGGLRAANYIARELQRLGLQPAGDSGTYFQAIPWVKRG
jgi:imidazolonepropionase-like amidohydrolase